MSAETWKSVPMPKKIRALAQDRRGFPIPFIVLRDTDNNPHFAVNNSERQIRVVLEDRCAICGFRFDREPHWYVGGPLSAFDPKGCYMDTAMHYECASYAVQVCPYLAAPRYLGRIDAAGLDPAKTPPGFVHILLDLTQIPERPPVFVAVSSMTQTLIPTAGGTYYVKPDRPYLAVEYWLKGKRLPVEEGERIVLEHCGTLTREALADACPAR